jgi:hypothetical protein
MANQNEKNSGQQNNKQTPAPTPKVEVTNEPGKGLGVEVQSPETTQAAPAKTVEILKAPAPTPAVESAPVAASDTVVAEAPRAPIKVIKAIIPQKRQQTYKAPAPSKALTIGPVIGDNKIIASAMEKATPIGRLILQQVEQYLISMHHKRPVTAIAGASEQVKFYRALRSMIENLTTDFNLVYSTVLALFEDEKNATLGCRHVNRFMSHVALNEKEAQTYLRLTNLLSITANPKSRAITVRQVDIDATLEHNFSEAGKQRVKAFYGKQ